MLAKIFMGDISRVLFCRESIEFSENFLRFHQILILMLLILPDFIRGKRSLFLSCFYEISVHLVCRKRSEWILG